MIKGLKPSKFDDLLGDEALRDTVSASTQESHVASYDFRQALHLSKDQLRVVLRTHEQFVRFFINELTMRLRIPVQIQVMDAVEATYEQFINELPSITVIQVMELNPIDGQMLVHFDTGLVFSMLDHFMGGGNHQRYQDRELTELESLLFRSLIAQLCPLYASAWNPFCEFSAVFGPLENHPRFVQIAAPGDSVLRVRLNCKLEQLTTVIHMVIPYTLLDKMVPKLRARHLEVHRSVKQRDNHHRELVSQHLLNSDATLSLRLGDTSLTMRQVMDLQVGDVIPLSHQIDIPLPLYVNGAPIASGFIGTLHGNYATKIVELSNLAEVWKESVQNDE